MLPEPVPVPEAVLEPEDAVEVELEEPPAVRCVSVYATHAASS